MLYRKLKAIEESLVNKCDRPDQKKSKKSNELVNLKFPQIIYKSLIFSNCMKIFNSSEPHNGIDFRQKHFQEETEKLPDSLHRIKSVRL